jgi:hypothetical protein
VIIYKTLIKPVLIYGAEPWVLSKADELRLGDFMRKIRRIYGPICEGAIWKSRYNEELYRLYDETDLVTTVKPSRQTSPQAHADEQHKHHMNQMAVYKKQLEIPLMMGL